jgi:hypothetical protein
LAGPALNLSQETSGLEEDHEFHPDRPSATTGAATALAAYDRIIGGRSARLAANPHLVELREARRAVSRLCRVHHD